jgi:hypothetical protein
VQVCLRAHGMDRRYVPADDAVYQRTRAMVLVRLMPCCGYAMMHAAKVVGVGMQSDEQHGAMFSLIPTPTTSGAPPTLLGSAARILGGVTCGP